MIKLLLLVLFGFVLYAFLSSLLRPVSGAKEGEADKRSDNHRTREISGETMVEDPVCGTFIPQAEAVKARIKGKDHYFCSQKCLEDFSQTRQDPH